MNEADSPSINLDELRLLPDWLREEPLPPSKQYAAHEGRGDERGGAGDRRDSRPYQGGARGGGGRGASGGGQRDARGGDARRDRGRPNASVQGTGGGRFARGDQRGSSAPPPSAPIAPAPVQIEFLPDARCLANIVKQIRSTHMAYPLFGTARMFLQEPERHLLRVTLDPAASQNGTRFYQLDENGPVALDRQVLERIAFEAMKDRYYVEQTVPKDPPKGNFTNVARCRLSGTLLGPTNYHGYQPALRALYESRFSRRMPFEEFRHSIEVVSDPALVERWKQEASTVTTISTREGEPPTVLESNAEARVHFRQHYFERLLREGVSFQLPGSVARSLPEPGMMMAIRQSNENELRYPAQFVQHLRKGLQDAGLHIFKHRKRIVYVAVTRPLLFAGGAVSANVAAIIEYIEQKPLCTRKDLAGKFLTRYVQLSPADPLAPAPGGNAAEHEGGEDALEPGANGGPTTDPHAKAKAALAADVRFLVQAGHIIEFHNGTFDLPLSAKTKEESTGRSLPKPNPLFTGERKINSGQAFKPSIQPEFSAPSSAGVAQGVESVASPVPGESPNESEHADVLPTATPVSVETGAVPESSVEITSAEKSPSEEMLPKEPYLEEILEDAARSHELAGEAMSKSSAEAVNESTQPGLNQIAPPTTSLQQYAASAAMLTEIAEDPYTNKHPVSST